jgi:hypothetical protein
MPGAFMMQNITSVSKDIRDKWGDRTTQIIYQNVPCRFSYDLSSIRRATVEDEIIVATVFVESKYDMEADYLITVEGDNYIVVDVLPRRDLFGNVHHKQLLLRSRG